MDNPLQNDLNLIAEHTQGLWDAKHIFITGATGFIGKWLLESLLRCSPKTEITILTRNPVRFLQNFHHLASKVELQQGNISTFDFTYTDYDYIIHAATEKDSRPDINLDITYHGTQRIIDYAKMQANLKSILFISSGIAGYLDSSVYSLGKKISEFMFLNSWLPVKIARCFTFVGPYLPLNANFAVGNFIYDALQGGPIIVYGNGTAHRSYMYAADLMIWLWTILFLGQNKTIYNVGSPQIISIGNLAHTVANLFSPPLEVRFINHPISSAFYVPNVLETMQELGLEIYTPLEEAIQKTIEWNKR